MFSFKKVLLFLAVLGVCAFASQTFAVTVFQDDFESDGAPLLDGPVIGAGDIGDNWTIFEGDIHDVQVCDDEGAHYVQLRNDGNEAQAWAVLSNGAAAGTLNETITLTSKIFKETSGDIKEGIAFVDAAPNAALNGQLFNIKFLLDGSITYDDGGSTTTFENVSYSTNNWQDITLTADMATKTFTLAVDGHGSDTGSWSSGNKIQSVVYYIDGVASGNFGYMDNVQIDSTGVVPEPGTLVLMLAGAMGLCAWRKRK